MPPVKAWIRALSILVPRSERRDWVEEWNAELAATGSHFIHALGALTDAWILRTDGWTMEGMLRDLRMAVKGFARKPFFTAMAGITLAMGIGANTAVFSVMNPLLFRPLPFEDPEELAWISLSERGGMSSRTSRTSWWRWWWRWTASRTKWVGIGPTMSSWTSWTSWTSC